MRQNPKKKFLITLIILTILFFVYQLIGFSYLSVETENLKKDKIEIQKGFYTINRKNDAELFEYRNQKMIFNGTNTIIKTEYGENDFLITYDKKYYFQFRHFVYNENDNVFYSFKLEKIQNKIYLNVNIKNGMKFRKPMNLISQANKMRCNNLIDEEKGNYNGIELK